MKEMQADTNLAAVIQDDSEISDAVDIDETVSFAPDSNAADFKVELNLKNTSEICDTECDDIDERDILKTSLEANKKTIAETEKKSQVLEHEPIDTEEADTEYGDSEWEDEQDPVLVYDVPRPALSIDEAAAILGKSIRAVERGITGKWGNRLPEGWKARKMKIDGQDEWRIIPPPNFRVRHSKVGTPRTEEMTRKTLEKPAQTAAPAASSSRTAVARNEESPGLLDNDSLFGFSFNDLLHSAGKRAKTELAKAADFAIESTMEYPTIVIDRSDDVELLLRELAEARKELNEERKMHLEDLRIMAEMQGSMRLLEVKSSQTATLKEELLEVTRTMQEHRRQYQEFLALPWWKRLFRKTP